MTGPGCAGVLLTGGASRRLGRAKAELAVDGERLVDRVAGRLRAVTAPVVEVGPGYTDLPTAREEPVGSGPLAALVAGAVALERLGAGRRPVLVLAVDLPFVEEGWLRFLAGAPGGAGSPGGGRDAVVARVDDVPQPLVARYERTALDRAAELVATGERSMRALLDAIDVDWVDEARWRTVTGPGTFVDVDTPDDVRRAGLEPPG